MKYSNRRAALGAAIRGPHVRARIRASASLESLLGELTIGSDVNVAMVSLESMQVEKALAEKAEAAVRDVLQGPPPQATVPTVYAVSAKGLNEGQLEDHSVLREAVRAKIDGGHDVTVALLPVPLSDEEPLATAEDSPLTDAAKQLVGEMEIPLLESMEALQDFLNGATAPDEAETVASEPAAEPAAQTAPEELLEIEEDAAGDSLANL